MRQVPCSIIKSDDRGSSQEAEGVECEDRKQRLWSTRALERRPRARGGAHEARQFRGDRGADVKSVASSRRSSQPRSIRSHRSRGADEYSITSSQADRRTEVYSELAEEDEWTAIQKFNTLLHYEEQKQAMLREQERRRLIRNELDKQL